MFCKKLLWAAFVACLITACSDDDDENNNPNNPNNAELRGYYKMTVGAPVNSTYEGGARISQITVRGDTGASVFFKSIGDPDANNGAGNYSTTGGFHIKAPGGLYQAQQIPVRENMPGQAHVGIDGKILIPEPANQFSAISGTLTIKNGKKGEFLEASFSCQAKIVNTQNEQDTVPINGEFRAVQ